MQTTVVIRQSETEKISILRRQSLQEAQHHRALLKQAEAVQARPNPLRQTARQLRGIRQTRRHRHLAQIAKSS